MQGNLAEAVADGTRVVAGDLLFRIDDEETLSRIESQEETLGQKEEELETARSEWDLLVETYEFTRRREEAERVHAALELSQRVAGLGREERRLLEIDIELARLDLEDRQERLERQRDLVEKGFAPPSSLDLPLRDLESAVTSLAERQTQRSLALAPLADEERVTLETALARATEIVQRSRLRHEREKTRQALAIEALELEILHIREDLDRLRAESARARVVAPAAGVIRLLRRFDWGARTWQTLGAGQRVWTANTLGELVDPSDLLLRVLVHESDLAQVRVGQSARVRVNAFPEREWVGHVLRVSALGQDRSDLSPIHRQAPPAGQAFFLVELEVPLPGVAALPGMTASVRLLTGEETP